MNDTLEKEKSYASEEKPVGLVGFTCPRDNQNKPFEWCFKHCQDHCEPLPLLVAMASHRKVIKNRYSTTEILNPPQIIYLQRHFPYYVYPLRRTFVTFGTGWHSVIERQKQRIKDLGLEDDYIIENNGKPFEVEIETPEGVAILTGIPDLYHISKKHLWDFKTMKYYYDVKNHLEGRGWGDSVYPWQVNIYRKYRFPEATEITIEALVKDFKRNMKELGVDPIMKFDVPLFRDEIVEQLVKTKLTYLLQVEKDPSKLRHCTYAERWQQTNPRSKDHMKCLRCMEHCDVSDICPQYQDRPALNPTIPTCAEDIL